MTKIPSIAVPSDDCEVTSDGQVYRPHEGETVWLWRDASVTMLRAWHAISALQTRTAGLADEPGGMEQILAITTETFGQVAEVVAPRLERWDWTDDRGQPLPSPSAEVLEGLSIEELIWLTLAVQGRLPAAEKKDSASSPTISLVTA